MIRERRHADAGADAHLVTVQIGKPVQLLAQTMAEIVRMPDRHDGELVSSQADGGHFAWPFDRLQGLGNGLQQQIANVMTERVVDALEVIQVDQEQPERLAGQPCPLQQPVPVGGHPGAILQLGRRIAPSEKFELADGFPSADEQHGGSDRKRRQYRQGKGNLVVEPVEVLLGRIKIDVNFFPIFVVFVVHASDDLVELNSQFFQAVFIERQAGRKDGIDPLHSVIDLRHDTGVGRDFANRVAAVDPLETDVDQIVCGRQLLKTFRRTAGQLGK